MAAALAPGGEPVVANLFDNDPRRVSDRIACYALFIDPALGRMGMSETEARASGRRVLMGKMPMQKVGRAREAGETQGFMKVLDSCTVLQGRNAPTADKLEGLHNKFHFTDAAHTQLNIVAPVAPAVFLFNQLLHPAQ